MSLGFLTIAALDPVQAILDFQFCFPVAGRELTSNGREIGAWVPENCADHSKSKTDRGRVELCRELVALENTGLPATAIALNPGKANVERGLESSSFSLAANDTAEFEREQSRRLIALYACLISSVVSFA